MGYMYLYGTSGTGCGTIGRVVSDRREPAAGLNDATAPPLLSALYGYCAIWLAEFCLACRDRLFISLREHMPGIAAGVRSTS